ncbi:hypothetical protein J1605_001449 [Eschrichtius robustus]|uniref:Uncharacterized protein n=1 Tax=Eschrichtius robustus TaxID=9764 RepID=A0AB34I4A9_ESCRO|nr:hypothetical protein J1605_001449 [Eschrichtius robustus]
MPMKANRIEPRSQKTKRWKKDSPWILHIFNHKCCVTSITGCYSCQWKIKQEKKSKRGPYCSWVRRDGKKLDRTFLDMGDMGWSLPS